MNQERSYASVGNRDLKVRLEKIEAQLQQAQHQRSQIRYQLEQLNQGHWQLQSQLSQIVCLLEPLKYAQLFDPSALRSQLEEIQAQLQQAQQERSQLQSQLSEIELRLEKSNEKRTQDVATHLSEVMRSHLEGIQAQLQQSLSELRLQVSQPEKVEPEKAPPQSTPQDELISAVGINYTQLRDLLAAGEWKKAEQETATVMLKICRREQERWLRLEDLANFPCQDLRSLNQLWVKYSNGRFGFSVQKSIWKSMGGTKEADSETWNRFSERVGWRVKDSWRLWLDLTFTIEAPEGHLPSSFVWGGSAWMLTISGLFSRVETCKL